MLVGLTIGLVALGVLAAVVIVLVLFRVVVEPSEVHIVQGRRAARAYGVPEGVETQGNAYYAWPAWVPIIGVQTRVLPLSVFALELTGYEAYDVGKVPFQVDVVAFFRIDKPAVAAMRIEGLDELREQLQTILQGAARTILAQHDVEAIMLERSKFGELFTTETAAQLEAWGVINVKNIELMDVRDATGSKTISNIMAKKASLIEMQSRTEVAANMRAAQVAEIEAKQAVAVRNEEAQQRVGERAAEKDREVGVATEKAEQTIKAEEKLTKEREMAVLQVEQVSVARITREQQVIAAEQERDTMELRAEGQKRQTILVADGKLEAMRREAEGVQVRGAADAEAKRLSEMATVTPQIELATAIGKDEGYQTYLVRIRSVERDERVGIEQAKALAAADIKVIANAGGAGVATGLDGARGLFSSTTGTDVAALLESVAQSEHGKAILAKLVGNGADHSAA